MVADATLSVREQCALLLVNRSSLYYQAKPEDATTADLKAKINTIYGKRSFYGVRRVTVQLRREGQTVNHKRVARLMRQLKLKGAVPKPNLSKRRHDQQIEPYLLRGVQAAYVNQVWGTDITYIRMADGSFMYLFQLLDWYSRYVVAWELSDNLNEAFVLRCLDRALAQAQPTILNSDQGSHFTSPQYLNRLRERGIQISMDGKGRAIDNVFTERVWKSVKYEETYLCEYLSPAEARQQLTQYLLFYNEERPHQSLNYQTPGAVYRGEAAAKLKNLAKTK